MRLLLVTLITGLCATLPVAAKPLHYQLDAARSSVGFETDFGQNVIRGQMPVTRADLTLDFERVVGSKVQVTLAPGGARANFPFATEAMRGDSVLAVRHHPEIRFESTRVEATATGARVSGNITIRGVTREVTLDARLYRPRGSEEGERDNLSILLTGSVSRAAFGASGFPNMVGDEVRLKILARIERKG